MENLNQTIKKKGGRRKKDIKKDQVLSIKCSLEERQEIEGKAKSLNLTVSHFMRQMALTGRIHRREIVFPKEVLQFTGTVNHIAANLNQIAKKKKWH